MHLDEATAGAFARATRLTAAEASQLCISSMSAQYPWAAPRSPPTSGAPGARRPVGVHLCDPVLPAVPGRRRQPDPAAARRRLAEGMAAAGRVRLPGAPAAAGTPVSLLPAAGPVRGARSARPAHPARRRRRPAPRPVPGRPQAAGRRRHARPCGARLDTPARAGEDSPAPGGLLAIQDRLLRLLRAEGPATAMSVGQPATPSQYFADIRLVSSLLNGTWPHSRNLITSPGTAGDLDQHIASTGGAAIRRHTLCDAPPLDARPGAALVTAAARILDDGDLRALGELLAPARDGASRKSPRGRWIRRYQRAGHDCSDGFRDALEPLVNSFQRADRRSRGRRAPAHQVSFAPEHVPERLAGRTTGITSTSATSAGTPGCSAAPPPSAASRCLQAARSPRRAAFPQHRPPLSRGIPRVSGVYRRPGRVARLAVGALNQADSAPPRS